MEPNRRHLLRRIIREAILDAPIHRNLRHMDPSQRLLSFSMNQSSFWITHRIIVIHDHQIPQFQMPCQAERLLANAFLKAPVASEAPYFI